jgi:hypothetical protein
VLGFCHLQQIVIFAKLLLYVQQNRCYFQSVEFHFYPFIFPFAHRLYPQYISAISHPSVNLFFLLKHTFLYWHRVFRLNGGNFHIKLNCSVVFTVDCFV